MQWECEKTEMNRYREMMWWKHLLPVFDSDVVYIRTNSFKHVKTIVIIIKLN